MMKNQYCKVGAVTSLTNGNESTDILEYQYKNFLEKAASINDAKLVEFFELKAEKIKNTLENLV